MSAGSAGPAGVKNLRAMFENKTTDTSTSPPSRGRSSPNGSVSSANSRQVSKVRSSFVAVERPGEPGQAVQWGLRKTSDVSSMVEVREQASMEESASPITSGAESTPVAASNLGVILKGSPFAASTAESVTQSLPIRTKQVNGTSDPKSAGTPKINGVANKVTPGNKKQLSEDSKPAPATEKATKSMKTAPSSLNTKVAASKSKDSPTSIKKSPALSKMSQDSPTMTNDIAIKPRGGVSKIAGVMQSANKAKEERAKTEKAHSESPKADRKATIVRAPSVASKPTAASKAHAQKSDAFQAEATQTKAPTTTKPSKLPSAATTGTAASAARKGTTDSEKPKALVTDRRSISSQTPRIANITTKASLAKKASRVSLVNGEDISKSRTSTVHKPADENFIARMTRPTASSTQKAHDKVLVSSPPRPQARKMPEGAKKSSRKSLSFTPRESTNGAISSGPNEIDTAKSVKATQVVSDDKTDPKNDEADEGEPGPAEENDQLVVSSQQAEVVGSA